MLVRALSSFPDLSVPSSVLSRRSLSIEYFYSRRSLHILRSFFVWQELRKDVLLSSDLLLVRDLSPFLALSIFVLCHFAPFVLVA